MSTNNHNPLKILRTLKYLWPQLTKINNFVTPETIEEYKEFMFKPSIKINNIKGYLNSNKNSLLDKFIHHLSNLPEVYNSFSSNLIYEKTFQSIQNSIIKKIQKSSTSADQEIQELLDSLLAEKHTFLFTRQLEGIDLVDIPIVRIGDCTILYFDDPQIEGLLKHNLPKTESEHFSNSVDKHIHNLKGKICIQCNATGNFKHAESKAQQKIEHSINILRFIAAFLMRDRRNANIIKITLLAEACLTKEDCITFNTDTNSFTLNYSRRFKNAALVYNFP